MRKEVCSLLLFNSWCYRPEKRSFWKVSDISHTFILFFNYAKLKARLIVLNVVKVLGLNENS